MNKKNLLINLVIFIGLSVGLLAEHKFKPILKEKDLTGWKVPSGNDKAGWYLSLIHI